MPMLDDAPQDSLAKLLLLGDSKAGKTHWIMQAAEAGFNVLYLDADVARQTLAKLSPAAKGRVAYLGVGDYVDDKGVYQYRFADFFKEFCTTGIFTWNDTKGAVFDRRTYDGTPDTGDVVWQIRPAQMDHRDLIVFDSWTAYAQSIAAWKAETLGVDLAEVEKVSREIYSGIANKATQTLVMIQRSRCHFAVIGHPDEYRKTRVPPGKIGNVKETDMIVEWTKMVPKSTSKPHSLTMAKFFSDVAWLDVGVTGKRTIDFKAASDRIIGGHFDDKVSADERGFTDLVKKIGGSLPAGDSNMSRWLTRYGPGEFQPAGSKPAPVLGKPAQPSPADAPAIDSVVPTPAKGLGGLTGLKFKGTNK